MYDMHASGAIGFGDGTKSVQSAGLLIKALQYVSAFNGVIIQIPDDQSVAPHGQMNEGIISTQIGLPGKPALAEEIMVARDLALANYTQSRIHITGVSLASSVAMIKKAKKEGVHVTCSTTVHHLLFTVERFGWIQYQPESQSSAQNRKRPQSVDTRPEGRHH